MLATEHLSQTLPLPPLRLVLHATLLAPDGSARPRLQLVQVVGQNLGSHAEKTVKVPLVFAIKWSVAARAAGTPSTNQRLSVGTVDVIGFATFWGRSLRSVYRDLDVFRSAFPGERDPGRLIGPFGVGLKSETWPGWNGWAALGMEIVEVQAATGLADVP